MSEILTDNIITEKYYERLFREFYTPLYHYAYTIISDEMKAEEAVQDVFLKLWQKRDTISIETSIRAYLYRAVHNHCINVMNRDKLKYKYQKHISQRPPEYGLSPLNALQTKELQESINQAFNVLPEKCRTVFYMSRQEELSYKEIAEKLSISIKTVENQIGKALKILRNELRPLLPILILFLFII